MVRNLLKTGSDLRAEVVITLVDTETEEVTLKLLHLIQVVCTVNISVPSILARLAFLAEHRLSPLLHSNTALCKPYGQKITLRSSVHGSCTCVCTFS